MKVRELIPMLVDRVSYFVVCDEATGHMLYDSTNANDLTADVGDAQINFVYFRDCEGSFEYTTETICFITAYYTWAPDDKEEDELNENTNNSR